MMSDDLALFLSLLGYAFKMSFYRAVQARCESLLRLNRRVIIAGDVNCAHQDIDLGDPVKLRSLGGIEAWAQLPHVLWFDQFLSRGGGHFVDLFRRCESEGVDGRVGFAILR